jgi:CrcB protein
VQDIVPGLVWVALGSGAGGMARFFISGLVARAVGETFPWGTMTVNVTGAFAIGAMAATAAVGLLPGAHAMWLFGVTGFLGSYTTVSSLSLQTLALAQDGAFLRAGGNILLTLGLGLAAAGLGFAAAGAAIGAAMP